MGAMLIGFQEAALLIFDICRCSFEDYAEVHPRRKRIFSLLAMQPQEARLWRRWKRVTIVVVQALTVGTERKY